MKAAKIAVVVIVTVILINAVRQHDDYPLPQILPMLDGEPLDIYTPIKIGICCLFVYGLYRLFKAAKLRRERDRQDRNHYYRRKNSW